MYYKKNYSAVVSVFFLLSVFIFSCSEKAGEKKEKKEETSIIQVSSIKINDRSGVRIKTGEEIGLLVNVYNVGDRKLFYKWEATGGSIGSIDSSGNNPSCRYIAPDEPGMRRVSLQVLQREASGNPLVATKFIDLDVYELQDLYVFNEYTPSGYMGAISNIGRRPTNYAGRSCAQITYRPGGTEKWAGMYWLVGSGDEAWRRRVNLQGYEKLEFYARSAGRGNEYVEFKAGDNEGSDFVSTGERLLPGDRWRLIELDLRNADLSSILPFCWVAPEPQGEMVFYFTNPVFKFRYED